MSESWMELLSHVKQADELQYSPDVHLINADLSSLLMKTFNTSKVGLYPFGSRIMGTGIEKSDLDIYIVVDDNFYKFSECVTTTISSNQDKLAGALRACSGIWLVTQVVKARIPIISVTHLPTGVDCDFNFSHGAAYCQNKLVNYLFTLQPIARYLCINLRFCMANCKLEKAFRNHVITLLVIFFLQNQKMLPAIEKVQRNCWTGMGPWVTNFNEKETLKSLGLQPRMIVEFCNFNKLKQGFFKYFANFNYKKIICPYLGVPVPTDNYISKMPPRFRNHVGFVRSRQLFINRSIILQDFIQLNQNKAHAITALECERFQSYCAGESAT